MRSITITSPVGTGSGSARARALQSNRRNVLGQCLRKGRRTSRTSRVRSTPSQSCERWCDRTGSRKSSPRIRTLPGTSSTNSRASVLFPAPPYPDTPTTTGAPCSFPPLEDQRGKLLQLHATTLESPAVPHLAAFSTPSVGGSVSATAQPEADRLADTGRPSPVGRWAVRRSRSVRRSRPGFGQRRAARPRHHVAAPRPQDRDRISDADAGPALGLCHNHLGHEGVEGTVTDSRPRPTMAPRLSPRRRTRPSFPFSGRANSFKFPVAPAVY